MGTRSDQRHVASKHVPYLGQLVEAGAAQDTPDAGDAGIGGRRLAHVGAVFHHRHGAEFQHLEHPQIAAPAALAEQHRPRAVEFDCERDQRQYGCNSKRDNGADDDVFSALDDRGPARVLARFDVHQADGAELGHPVGTVGAQEVGRQMGDDVEADGEVGEFAGNVVDPALRNLGQGDDDAVDTARPARFHQIVEAAHYAQALGVDTARSFARIEHADEAQSEGRI